MNKNLRYPDAILGLFTRIKIYHTASLPSETKSSLFTQASRSHTNTHSHTHLSQSYCSTKMNSNGHQCQQMSICIVFRRRRRRWSVHTVNSLTVYLRIIRTQPRKQTDKAHLRRQISHTITSLDLRRPRRSSRGRQ